jgi:hypothetical protein
MIKSGFYDSINHDRLYGADDFSDYFEGLISDGIYAGIGKEFRVFADGSTMGVQVDTGRAKILNKYVRNTDILEVEIDAADSENPRWDAVCVSVNLDEAYRNGYIDVHKGTPAADPQKPDVPDTDSAKLFVLAYVYVPAQAAAITAENVNDNRGAANCPYVVGITGTENIVNVIQEAVTNAQAQISGFVTDAQSKIETALKSEQARFNLFLINSGTQLQNLKDSFNEWWEEQKKNPPTLEEYVLQSTAEEGQTQFPIETNRYTGANMVVNVYKNGLHLMSGLDYRYEYHATEYSYFVLTNPATAGDKITIQTIKIS